MRKLLTHLFDDLLDQQTPERDAGQPVERVVDRVERGRVRHRRIEFLARLQQRTDPAGGAANESDLDEDQGDVSRRRMEERVDASVCGLQPPTKLGFGRHRVDRFVMQQIPVQLGRRVPGDLRHPKKSTVEPRRQQMVEVVIEGPQARVAAHQSAQVRAHLDQGESCAGRVVDAAKQLLTGGFDGAEQFDHLLTGVGVGCVAARAFPPMERGPDPVVIDAVDRGDVFEEAQLAGVVEVCICTQRPGRDSAYGCLTHITHQNFARGEQPVQRSTVFGSHVEPFRGAVTVTPGCVSHAIYICVGDIYNSDPSG